MTRTEYKDYVKQSIDGTISDDKNPIFVLDCVGTELLVKIAKGEIDCVALAKLQLERSGLDLNGKWVGFDHKNLD